MVGISIKYNTNEAIFVGMTVYVITKDIEVLPNTFTSLKSACEEAGVSYDSAVRGKLAWLKGSSIIKITETTLEKQRR